MRGLLRAAAFTALAFCAAAENIFPRGGFDSAAKTLHGDAIPNSGAVSLFTEDANWNRCGKLEIVRVTKRSDEEIYSACAFIGGDGKEIGLPVKGDTLYDFSFEVRSDTVKSIGVKFQDWTYSAAAGTSSSLRSLRSCAAGNAMGRQ